MRVMDLMMFKKPGFSITQHKDDGFDDENRVSEIEDFLNVI
jgi:hypothetical protein